jgi:uncharacterized protein (TIGR02145 family)
MTQNLKELPNGVAINTSQWLATTQPDLGFYGFYNTVSNAGWQTTEPAAGEGILYQWSAAMNGATIDRAQGICPQGWHVPSDCEIMYLEHGLGMEISQQTLNNNTRSNTSDSQGTPGYKLRNVGTGGTGATNASGFSLLMNGVRFSNGNFQNRNNYGYFWSSTSSGATTAIYRRLQSGTRGIFRYIGDPRANAFSVRCLKD